MPRLNELLQATSGAPPAEYLKDPPPAEDEVDPDACPRCGGAGYLRRDVPLGDPEFGKAVPCPCTQLEGRDVRQARLERYSNLGPLTRLTFENLNRKGLKQKHQVGYQKCVEDAEIFVADPHGWLTLRGASGCGKTHIAAAIANACIRRGTPALFVVVPDLLDHLRSAYKPDADLTYDQLFEQVRNAPVLVLDDLGTQNATPWAQEKLFQIVNHRFNARLPTVFTTNAVLRDMDERFRSRLTDPGLARIYELADKSVLDHHSLNGFFQPRIQSMTFENFYASHHGLTKEESSSLQGVRSACLKYAEQPDGWVILTGQPGCGKTHLAAAIAHYRLLQGDVPMFVKVSRLLQKVRSTFDQKSELTLQDIMSEIENAPLLILDDLFFKLSSAWKSEWANEQLFELVDYRYESRLPTIITTTLTEAAMSTDDITQRFAARLWDPGIGLELHIKARPYKIPKTAGAGPRGRPKTEAS